MVNGDFCGLTETCCPYANIDGSCALTTCKKYDKTAVEAIPVDWINRYLLHYLYLDNERLPDDEVDDGYFYIKMMLDDWKKEKENVVKEDK